MKKLLFAILILFSISYSQNLTGTWEGPLDAGGMKLRLVFKIEQDENKNYKGILLSPDQGNFQIPFDTINFNDNKVYLVTTPIKGSFEGTLKEDSTLVGEWKQMGQALPLILKKVAAIAQVVKPQTPKPPFNYNSEEVSFVNKEDNLKLTGTFSYPKTGKNFPVVVMVSGSGKQDRDETLFNHKPFAVIADHLAQKGIAVLRYDDRGAGGSEGVYETATTLDLSKDANAAIQYLLTRKEINKKKIGLIGHSEGGMIAPIVANKNKEVDFLVLLAGPGVKGSELLVKQTEDILKTYPGYDEVKTKKDLETAVSIYNIIIQDKDSAAVASDLNKYLDNVFEKAKQDPTFDTTYASSIRNQYNGLNTKWFRYFLKYDPAPALEKVKIPVLALNGEKDLQVDSKINLAAIEKSLKKAGNKNYSIVSLPNLNHLFQKTESGSPMEYGQLEETFSADALNIISDWIIKLK